MREPSGDLCGVRDHGHRRLTKCGGLSVTIIDIPTTNKTIELAVCELHYAELRAADNPTQLAREWVNA